MYRKIIIVILQIIYPSYVATYVSVHIMIIFNNSGHSRGLRPLASKNLVLYCTSGETELYNDPEVSEVDCVND